MDEESKVSSKPIDLDAIFNSETIVNCNYKGQKITVHLRECTLQIDRDFQRLLTKTNTLNGKTETATEALTAEIWLFDQLCTSVTVGEADDPVENFKERLSPDLKRALLFAYRQRITIGIS